MRHLRSITLIISMFSIIGASAQSNVDSLKTVIETTENDSIKVEALYFLALAINDTPQGIEYATQALEIAKENNFVYLAGQVVNSLGIFYYQLGNYEQTLDYFYQALSYYQSLGDSSSMSKSYNNIGLVLSDLDRLDETIKYLLLALKLKYKLADSTSIASGYSNLGLAYQEKGQLDSAVFYFRKALELDKKFANSALDLFIDYNNIGKNHYLKANYDSTLYYYNKAVMLSDEFEAKYYKAEMLLDYGRLNSSLKEYDRAIEKFNSCLLLAAEAEAKALTRDCYKELSSVYENLSNVEQAFKYYQKYDSVNDLIFNEEQMQKITAVESNFQVQQGQKEIELLKQQAEIKDLRIQNDQYLKYFLLACIVLIAALVILQYRKNIFKTKTNEILQIQNEEIVDKNKDIMDSIAYAKNIQRAILPSHKSLNQLFNDAFVYSKARDVVNGDFYWVTEKDHKIIIAAVDCTGHGVPAAFINVLGNTHLNNIVKERSITEPAEILNHLNKRMVESIDSGRNNLKTDDGMDLALCHIDKKTGKVLFAGAKRPLYFIKDGKLLEIKGDGMPVGGDSYDKDRSYNQHKVTLSKGDSIYLFTDGIVDQFGGKKNKKFMYPRLRDLLKRIHSLPMEDQRIVIKDDLNMWKGKNDQTDDILIVGIRI